MISKFEEKIYQHLPESMRERRREELKKTIVGGKEKLEEAVKISFQKQIHEVFLSTVVFVILMILLIVFRISQEDHITISRNETGGETKEEQLIINEDKDLTLNVNPKGYKKSQIPKVLEKGNLYLKNHLKGKNNSSQDVKENLDMPEKIPGENIDVRWETTDPTIVDEEGNVFSNNVKSPVIVHVTATLSCQGEEKICQYPVCVIPGKTKSIKKDKVVEEIKKVEKESIDQESFQIPKKIFGSKVDLAGESNQLIGLGFLGGCIIGLLWYRRQREIKDQVIKTKEDTLMEYPMIMNKFLLYLGAGLSVPAILEEIYMQYKQKQNRSIFVYEQMGVACRKIQMGVSQVEVFQDFGKALGTPCYRKLTTLLVRSITQGSKDLFDRLKEEEEQAFFERKEQAKRLGEEASTKLLAPMIVMLILILALLMFPALATFS